MAKSNALISAVSKAAERNEIDDLIYRLDAIETTLSAVRNLSRVYADLAHEVPEESAAVTIDAEAMRGTMTFFTAQLDEAIDSLQIVHVLTSQLGTDDA